MKYNATTDGDSVVCVFPISGRYGILNRALFYVMLLWGVFAISKRWNWIILATWAYIISYSTAAALHFWVMVGMRRRGFYNLDYVGAWAVLSTAALVAAPLAIFSKWLKNGRYRPIFNLWSYIIYLSCVIFFFNYDDRYPLEPACWSGISRDPAVLLTSPSQLLTPGAFNCTYKCFDNSYSIRDKSEATVVMASRAFGRQFKLLKGVAGVLLVIAFLGVLGACLSRRRRTKKELEDITKESRANGRARYGKKYGKRWGRFGKGYSRPSHYDHWMADAKEEMRTGKTPIDGTALWVLYCPIALPIAIAFNEVYLLAKQPLPVSESVYAVSQWGPWVSVWVVILAASFSTTYEPRFIELQQKWEELDGDIAKKAAENVQKERMKSSSIAPDKGQVTTTDTPAKERNSNITGDIQQPEQVHTGSVVREIV